MLLLAVVVSVAVVAVMILIMDLVLLRDTLVYDRHLAEHATLKTWAQLYHGKHRAKRHAPVRTPRLHRLRLSFELWRVLTFTTPSTIN